MALINTDLSQQFQWVIRQGAQNTFTIAFNNSVAFDISAYAFTLNIRRIGQSTNALQLTESSGLTNGGATGILTVSITTAQSSSLTGSYFYELVYVKTTKTYGMLHGTFDVIDYYNPNNTTSSLTISVTLTGTALTATLTLGGSDSTFDSLTPVEGDILQYVSGVWTNRTLQQLATSLIPYLV